MCSQHGNNGNAELGFTSENFPQGTHMCYIYSDDEERESIISKFIKSGLDTNEKVAYFAHAMNQSDMLELLEKNNAGLTEENSKHFIVAKAKDTYCPSGEFVVEDMVERLIGFYRSTIQEGYSGARVSGEMAWALEGVPGSERLMVYESMGDIVLKPNPVTVICQYDARKFDGVTLLNCLKVHPYMIVRGQVVQNPYYLSHEEFMNEFKRSA
jgi:hypothetical protein